MPRPSGRGVRHRAKSLRLQFHHPSIGGRSRVQQEWVHAPKLYEKSRGSDCWPDDLGGGFRGYKCSPRQALSGRREVAPLRALDKVANSKGECVSERQICWALVGLACTLS